MSNKPPQKPPLKKPSPESTLNPDDYRHSPVHYAVATKDHTSLSHIISSLPRLSDPTRIHSHSDSLTQEKISDQISSVLDRRDNARGETALHVAVKVNDTYSARALANAGADVSLQNKQGWNALQEAVVRQCTEIVAVLVQCHHVSAWCKWRRRLPLLTLALRGMRDFYMEISFHFESSIVPFVGKIAPSDTYKIWKRGCNVRADTSLAGYDGLKIQRANQSFLFLGDGDENLEIPSGSLIVLNHDDKRIYDAFENAGVPLSESDIANFCAQTSVYRPGMDVTKAELLATTNWRRQKKVENVGDWKARVYEIQNVHFSFRSRKIVQNSNNDSDQLMPLELVEDSDDDGYFVAECPRMSVSSNIPDRDRPRRRHSSFVGGDREVVSVSRKSVDIIPEPRRRRPRGNPPPVVPTMRMTSPPRVVVTPVTKDKEYVKTLKPSVWLTDDFPLKTEELLPLLDILANKVKAVRRMRELLTTKFPQGTFPVKVAIPVVPTVRVMITFTKFVELPPLEDQFFTPFSSPRHLFSGRGDDDKDDDDKGVHRASVSSRFSRSASRSGLLTHKVIPQVAADPFDVPVGYSWSSFDEKGKKLKKSKSTARKAK